MNRTDPYQRLIFRAPQLLLPDGTALPATYGRGGLAPDKREGDLKTPVGLFPMRCCYYRPDRMEAPLTGLPVVALSSSDGWCDDPADARYNQHVTLPYSGRHETLWRDDAIYDLIIPLGYNDNPVTPGKGSAIFLHLMRDDGVGTEGCIALQRADLLALLPHLGTGTQLEIQPQAPRE